VVVFTRFPPNSGLRGSLKPLFALLSEGEFFHGKEVDKKNDTDIILPKMAIVKKILGTFKRSPFGEPY
jgi:hypothetical protein